MFKKLIIAIMLCIQCFIDEIRCATTSIIWSASPYFQTDVFVYSQTFGSANNTLLLTVNFNQPATTALTQIPSVSIKKFDYPILGPDLSFHFKPWGWTTTQLRVQAILMNYQSCMVTLGYIIVDPTVPFSFSSNYF